MKFFIPVLICVSISMFFISCKKSISDELPPITQTGENTFGCKINGVVYVPSGGDAFNPSLYTQYDATFEGGKFQISTKEVKGANSIYLTVNADSIHSAGIYSLVKAGKYWVFYSDIKNNSCSFETINDSPISGALDLSRFDELNRVASGTFSFKINTAACGTIEVTEGRFDVRF